LGQEALHKGKKRRPKRVARVKGLEKGKVKRKAGIFSRYTVGKIENGRKQLKKNSAAEQTGHSAISRPGENLRKKQRQHQSIVLGAKKKKMARGVNMGKYRAFYTGKVEGLCSVRSSLKVSKTIKNGALHKLCVLERTKRRVVKKKRCSGEEHDRKSNFWREKKRRNSTNVSQT